MSCPLIIRTHVCIGIHYIMPNRSERYCNIVFMCNIRQIIRLHQYAIASLNCDTNDLTLN